jgi:c-di-GMP-binding flagellar brake protein YcgR
VSFYSRILAHEDNGGGSIYRLELPEEIGRNHSRGAYRVHVGEEEGLGFSMGLENELELAITNLSVEGLKLSFSEDISEQLRQNLIHRDCLIQLPNDIDIDCSLEIKNIYRIHHPHLHSLAGGIINIPNPQHRAKLNQYLTGVQRKQRRRELRE